MVLLAYVEKLKRERQAMEHVKTIQEVMDSFKQEMEKILFSSFNVPSAPEETLKKLKE